MVAQNRCTGHVYRVHCLHLVFHILMLSDDVGTEIKKAVLFVSEQSHYAGGESGKKVKGKASIFVF